MMRSISFKSVEKLNTEISEPILLVNTKTEGEYRYEFQRIAEKFSALRNFDKAAHFNTLDTIISKNEDTPNTSAFKNSLFAIYNFEVEAKGYVVEYKKIFLEFEGECCHGNTFIEEIPFFNGKDYVVNTQKDRCNIKKSIDVEEQNKSIQIEMFGQIPGAIMDYEGVSEKEKLIIVRSVQRYLNALTLTLNSPMGVPAINNIKELSKLIGYSEPVIPVQQWTVDSVRAALLPHLESVIKFIYDASLPGIPSPGTLSKNGMELLANKCMEISNFVDQYHAFNVPDIFKNKNF